MPFYRPLAPKSTSAYPFPDPLDPAMRVRTARGILRLREQFSHEVPKRTLDETLLLATWNIREFDAGDKSDARLAESLFYIAEVLSHFDLIAVQEVREDLRPLDRVMSILGPWWKYIVTDVTYGQAGNGERMAFIHDTRKVTFGGLAGEVVLPPDKHRPPVQLARTPFVCGFKANWSRFNLCTVHIYYGDSKPDDPRRVQEVVDLASLLAKYLSPPPPKQPGQPKLREDLVLLGDFNIFTTQDKEMAALTEAGFTIPPELANRKGSNLDESKFYDQIAFRVRTDRFATNSQAGVFNYTKSVLRAEDEAVYAKAMSKKVAAKYQSAKDARAATRIYHDWSTFQMSDHLVLWVELRIDFAREYLLEAADRKKPPPDHEPPMTGELPTDPTSSPKSRKPRKTTPRRKAVRRKNG